ncbi:hypothetical protein Poli38472_013659 [Pythium oligandrum]|uniref:Uncharacterized protein n=1 Tax=Pythium oligandrum TaxID=41045 RepID=A0A8K1CE47_PYTOL|nr:hypothetical protein Poli38472_013659 [Pythium oligandrum]|eukprot:TMW61196.1 hypothetical protein Poli38472_013659 [Pythium oligandrum]
MANPGLKTKDFVVEDNMIPRADLVGYAQRFANCLSILGAENQSEYRRSLPATDKDGSRHLHLAIGLHVRDIGDDVGQMQKQIGNLEEEKTTIVTKELPQLQETQFKVSFASKKLDESWRCSTSGNMSVEFILLVDGQTVELKIADFVVEDNSIPRASLVNYAQRFANCLEVATTSDQNEYRRSLTPSEKDGSRHLHLAIQLHVGGFDTQLEYAFLLMPIALERVDILAAQVRDLDDMIKGLMAQMASAKVTADGDGLARILNKIETIETKEKEKRELTYAQLVTTGSASANHLTWSLSSPTASSPFTMIMSSSMAMLEVSGLFLITVHFPSKCGEVFEIKVNDVVVQTLANGEGDKYDDSLAFGRPKKLRASTTLTMTERCR